MTKAELETWIKENPKNGWGGVVIDGSYEFIEVEGVWKLDVKGNVDLTEMGLIELPNVFHLVSGCFSCDYNQITSLKHCPNSVKELYCNHNQLTSLENCPSSVKSLGCYDNQITSLKHCPDSIEYLDCENNQLTSLEYCPSSVEALDCRDNQLTSLEHTPLNLKELNSDFSDEEYKAYIIETKDKLESEASNERVDDIEQLMGLDR